MRRQLLRAGRCGWHGRARPRRPRACSRRASGARGPSARRPRRSARPRSRASPRRSARTRSRPRCRRRGARSSFASTTIFTRPSVSRPGDGAPERAERERRDAHLDSGLLGVGLGEAGGRDLGIGEDRRRHRAHVPAVACRRPSRPPRRGPPSTPCGRAARRRRRRRSRRSCGFDVRSCLSISMNPRAFVFTCAASRPSFSVFGLRPTETRRISAESVCSLPRDSTCTSTLVALDGRARAPCVAGEHVRLLLLERAGDDGDEVGIGSGQELVGQLDDRELGRRTSRGTCRSRAR